MVSNLSITFMIISLIICLVLPIGGIIYLKRKYKVKLKTFFIGMLAFFIAVQVLEAPIHYYLLSINKATSQFIMGSSIVYMLYGGLMAGIFEETARLISFKYLIKDRYNTTAITYGLGHGGIEAILIGGISCINSIVYSIFINNGSFQSMMKAASVSEDLISKTYNQYVNSSSFLFLMTGVERILALSIQISLSVLVFYAVKEKKYIYFFLAILCHAFIDFPAGLYQMGVISNIYIVELLILVEVIVLVILIFKKLIKKDKINNEII